MTMRLANEIPIVWPTDTLIRRMIRRAIKAGKSAIQYGGNLLESVYTTKNYFGHNHPVVVTIRRQNSKDSEGRQQPDVKLDDNCVVAATIATRVRSRAACARMTNPNASAVTIN